MFRPQRKVFIKNELISWFWIFVLTSVALIGFLLFSQITPDKLPIICSIIFLLKLRDFLVYYRVAEIRIDKSGNHITFKLHSFLSWVKEKQYPLIDVQSIMIRNSGRMKIFKPPVVLIIKLSDKEAFKITSRFGFAQETLAAIHDGLKQADTCFK